MAEMLKGSAVETEPSVDAGPVGPVRLCIANIRAICPP